MVLASPGALAKSELETLRSLCSEQERQIRQLEEENSLLRSGNRPPQSPAAAKAAPVSPAKPAAAAPTSSTYTVKAGDTLSKIAKDHLGSAGAYMKIYNANKDLLTDPDKIKPGQVLKIP